MRTSPRPPHATAMIGAHELHMEVLDPATRNVWQSVEPISLEDSKALPLEASWIPLGVGRGAMDEHWFDRSPGASEDGPMDERDIGGRRFGFCARPIEGPSLPAGPEGPRQMRVEKHHVACFRAGRTVQILRLPDGQDFVHVVEGGPEKPPLALPGGWEIRTVELQEDWIARLPAPTTVFFFPNRDSFQGPISV